MHPCVYAEKTPDKTAIIMATDGSSLTYRELEEQSNQVAHYFRSKGLKTGDHVAMFLENHLLFYVWCWGAQRAGLYFTAISTRLSAPEAAYIVNDCDARILLSSKQLGQVAGEMLGDVPKVEECLMVDGVQDGFKSFEETIAEFPRTRIADETAGMDMLYSSGTTGRPKGVKIPLTGESIDAENPLMEVTRTIYQFSDDMIYLSPAPLYHAAPMRFNMTIMRCGGTSVMMEHFNEEEALRLIEKYQITHSQWVPTMFVRMLKMPEDVRTKYDVSSLKLAIHAAAPCPIEVKRQMIDWWGPILFEYYAGSEGNGATYINSEDWLAHPGSVGRSLTATLHIVDEDGSELPPGEIGTIYFEGGGDFAYHKDEDKTAGSYDHRGWSTLGDIGYVDEEGYLYLTDRKAFMIISGGVNIYPQEAENVLIGHPKVADVAVFGVPNEEFGEEVKAAVQPANWADRGEDLEQELIAYCKEHLASIKCPRSVDFDEELPRHPTGKLYKRLLRDRYWGNKDSKIV